MCGDVQDGRGKLTVHTSYEPSSYGLAKIPRSWFKDEYSMSSLALLIVLYDPSRATPDSVLPCFQKSIRLLFQNSSQRCMLQVY